MAGLDVLGRVSSINVRKVLWICEELGIDYAREDWGAGDSSTRNPRFLAFNPNALVPVIRSDDGILWESNTICRYLVSKSGRDDLLPTDPWGRALVERWMDWQATELNVAWRGAFMGLVRKDPAYADPQVIEASVKDWNGKMEILAGQLDSTGAFVAGENFTVADIVIGLSVNRWFWTAIERPHLPSVSRYFEQLRSRPAFQRAGCDATA